MAEPVKRNVVGEADPETRRRMLQEALRSGPPVKPTKPEKAPADTSASVFDAARDLARRQRQIELETTDPEEAARRKKMIEAMRGKMK